MTEATNGQPLFQPDGRVLRTLRTLLIAGAAGLLAWLLITYGRVLVEVSLVVFGAYLLSLASLPVVERLEARRIPRGLSTAVLYLLLIAFIGGLLYLTIPSILAEVGGFRAGGGTEQVEAFLKRINSVPFLRRFDLSVETLLKNNANRMDAIAAGAVNVLGDLAQLSVDLLLVLVLAYYFNTDRRLGTGLLLTWVPRHRRWRVRQVFRNTSARLTRWIVAQVALALSFAIPFGIGLWLLGLPFALTIAIIGGMLEFIPFLGGAVSLALSTLVALTFKPQVVIWVVLLYFAIAQTQASVLQPLFYGRAVSVHPAAILVALLVGGQIGGVFGALFAVPLAVVLFTMLDEIEKPGQAEPPPDGERESLAEKLPPKQLPEDREVAAARVEEAVEEAAEEAASGDD